MAVFTNNIYGKISVENSAIENFVSHIALDSYGIVGFAPSGLLSRFIAFFTKNKAINGVKAQTAGDRISIDLFVFIKYGVSIKAVSDALKEAVKYKTEKFTGMIVETVNVTVSGVQQ